MSEVSTWDPVDDNNKSAPPAGAPEGMQPSAVNNTLRAIQGAVRRMYDTFAANFAALPTTYLRLTGGTLRDGIDIARFDTTACYNQDGSWHFISDLRAKFPDYQPYRKGLQACLEINPIVFRYLNAPATPRYGLVAQDVAEIVPEMVGETEVEGETMLTLAPTHLTWILVNSCKELAMMNAALAARVTALEKRR